MHELRRLAVVLALSGVALLKAWPVCAQESRATALIAQAEALERQENGFDAVKLYMSAARMGSLKAAKRLEEIYANGIPGPNGIQQDYQHSAQWQHLARLYGRIPEEDGIAPAALMAEAASLERAGDGKNAVRLYARAVRTGHADAAVRLGQIYEKGIPGVSPDIAEALKWYTAARTLGAEPLKKR